MAPNATLGSFVGGMGDPEAVLVQPLAMQSARQHQPFGLPDFRTAMVALVHFSVIGQQKARRADRAHGLLAQAAVYVLAALELQSRDMLDRFIDRYRLDHEQLDFSYKQIGKIMICGVPSIMIWWARSGP